MIAHLFITLSIDIPLRLCYSSPKIITIIIYLIQTLTHLSDCKAGQTSQITALKGDLDTKMRLVNLGFHTHSVVKLVLKRGRNLVVCVDGSRFAIDKTIAESIQVEVIA